MTTTSTNLRLITTRWPDLADMLGTPGTSTWPPSGLRHHLAALDTRDDDVDEQGLLRHLERDPAQIGVSNAPISVTVFDTMTDITDRLTHCATITASAIQRPTMAPAPQNWPTADRARRNALAADDANDPRRWQYTGRPRTAPQAAAWLLARVTAGRGGPFRPLTPNQLDVIAREAERAAADISRTLDTATQQRRLTPGCPTCQGTIEVHGGAGAPPLAHCTGCGHIWTTAGPVAA